MKNMKGKLMTDSEKIDLLINLKLLGCLDSYKLLAENENINKTLEELKAYKKPIIKIIQKLFDISDELYRQFELENSKIQYIKSRCSVERIKGFGSIRSFYDWYKNEKKSCCYCGIDEIDLKKFFEFNQTSKRTQRGKSLEIERILTDKNNNKYNKINCALACYVCNNAKSDLIYYKDFEPIAKGINLFWQAQLKKEIIFPSEFYKRDIRN